jgi:hypothetical protein
MANQKIHEYLLERFSIGDDDYFDMDYYDGANYTSAKVKGSIIKNLSIQEYQPPIVPILSGHLSGGSNVNPNAGQGFHVHLNGTGSPARLDYNIPLKNNGINYDGSTLKIVISFQMYNSNSGGDVGFEIIGKYVTADGLTNAESSAIPITTSVNVTGRGVNVLYKDEIANFSGGVNSDYLMLTIKRLTGGGYNSNQIDAIGIELIKA